MGKRKVQEINASSMADIAFLLLIFFLVTTTMDVDFGLARRLPPPLPPNEKQPDTKVKDRDLFKVLINSDNQLLVQGEPMQVSELRAKAEEFIKNEGNDPDLPELLPVDVVIDGKPQSILTTKNHVISLQNDRGTQYQKYIEVQNELVAAYDDVRNQFSMQHFGKLYDDLSPEDKEAVQKIYPQKISEAEPKNYGGGTK